MSKVKKTNVMRLLEQQGIAYEEHHYFGENVDTGVDIAEKMGNDPDQQFKTLVTVGRSGAHYVYVIPVNTALDLKKAARAVSEKSIAMIKEKELLPLTGYVHGGCSPIGMKSDFKTVVNETAELYDTIIFSAGKVGVSVEMNPYELDKLIDSDFADVIKEK